LIAIGFQLIVKGRAKIMPGIDLFFIYIQGDLLIYEISGHMQP